MPTSPKTAKEVLEEFEIGCKPNKIAPHSVDMSWLEDCILKAMRAAVEAVDIEGIFHEDDMPHCNCAEYHFKTNVSRFFNDDPTSSLTPRN